MTAAAAQFRISRRGVAQTSHPAEAQDLTLSERRLVQAGSITFTLVIFTQKLAIGPNIEIPFFVVSAFSVWLLWRGYARFGIRTVAYLFISACFVVAGLLSKYPLYSPTSVLFAIGVHAPFAAFIPIRRVVYLRLLKSLLISAYIIAALILFQWGQQFLGHKMISMDDYLPDSLLFNHYNYIQKINYFSAFYKPNAFFMLETSNASQLLAIAALVELCIFRRLLRFSALVAVMLSTLGGTGMFILAACLPVALFYLRPSLVVGLAAAAVLLVVAGSQFGLLDYAMVRAGEFGQAGTSGNGRFVASFRIIAETVNMGPRVLLAGLGPGAPNPNITNIQDTLNPIAKLITDYGIIVGGIWLLWFHTLAFRARAPIVITLAVLLQYEVVGGGFMVPINTYYVLFFSALFVLTDERLANPARLRRRAPSSTDRAGAAPVATNTASIAGSIASA